ncbi:LysR family pca operon transcriptional activator [Paraburkholderia sp. UCT70]|uniref:LysR family transcriptional regulator n=1 Tax=Paraburkholderia sp. UCT70 TaxID=2991068 RepID=UPI003D1A4A1C
MDVELRQLRHLVAVAEAKNLSRAAEALGLTQPALSRSIAGLEAAYGLKIFDRTRVGMSITILGEAVLEEARRLLLAAGGFDHNLRQLGTAETGQLCFGMGPLPAAILLPDLLPALARAKPRLHVQSVVRPAPDLVAALLAGQLEFCLFAEGQVPLPDMLSVRSIGTITVGAYIRAGHPLAGRSELTSEDFLPFPVGSVGFRRGGKAEQDFPLSPTVQCENYYILKQMMLETDMIWLASPELLRIEMAAGLAVRLALPEILRVPPSAVLQIVRLANRTASPAARLALELLDRQFAAMRRGSETYADSGT